MRRTIIGLFLLANIGCANPKQQDAEITLNDAAIAQKEAEHVRLTEQLAAIKRIYASHTKALYESMAKIQSDAIGEGQKLIEYNKCHDACLDIPVIDCDTDSDCHEKNEERDKCQERCDIDTPEIVKASC